MAWIVVGGLVLLALGVGIRLIVVSYRRLFSDEHFLEISKSIGSLKTAAISNIETDDDLPSSPDDPRVLRTTAGLAIFYTVRNENGLYIHHYSVSVPGRHTAHAVGATFILFAAKLLGFSRDHSHFLIGESTVHHCEVRLSWSEHEKVATSPVPEVSLADIQAFRVGMPGARREIEWHRLVPPRG